MDMRSNQLLSGPILERIRGIEGWLDEDEADLLIAGLENAIRQLPEQAVVEVGSYCGRSTIVLASVVQALGANCRVYAIDPHKGQVGALDTGLLQGAPTLQRFLKNIELAGLSNDVEVLCQYSYEVNWSSSIAFILIDGLHDYANVSRDFLHFEHWISNGGFIAFHDYGNDFPGVKAYVDQLLSSSHYFKVGYVRNMILLRKDA